MTVYVSVYESLLSLHHYYRLCRSDKYMYFSKKSFENYKRIVTTQYN